MLSGALSRTWQAAGCLKGRVMALNTPIVRSLGVLSSSSSYSSLRRPSSSSSSSLIPSSHSLTCSCGCGLQRLHTKGDKELVEFLKDEIKDEKTLMEPNLPTFVGDFAVKTEEADVTLTRNFQDEKITISLNVNHTVDTGEGEPVELSDKGDDTASLKSRPNFEVDIEVGRKTLSFTCSYLPMDLEGEKGDVFGINEVTIYQGEWSEATYCVSGDILDGMMYDLLMNMLEERGIDDQFAQQMTNFCSDYEHSLYVRFLQGVSDFVTRK